MAEEFEFDAAGDHIHKNLSLIASRRKDFHSMGRIKTFDVRKLKPKELDKLTGKIITLAFGGSLRDVLGGVHSQLLLSEPREMLPDKNQVSSLIEPIVKRRDVTVVNFLRFKDVPVQNDLFMIDLFRGSAPSNLNKKSAQNSIAKLLHKELRDKDAVSATGMVFKGPRPPFAKSSSNEASFMIAFRMLFPKEDTYHDVGYELVRRAYKQKLNLQHEVEEHKV